jgi:hypothetical protein
MGRAGYHLFLAAKAHDWDSVGRLAAGLVKLDAERRVLERLSKS